MSRSPTASELPAPDWESSTNDHAEVRLGKLRQDQFAFEECTVLNTVIMGHEALWQVKEARDRREATGRLPQ